MRSSSGKHFAALDQVRGFAVVLVVCWHFLHSSTGYPVPFEGAPAFPPLALVDEGHTGVALFMVLSGYLFAKLLEGADVNYVAFFRNRLLRLAPLLLVTFALAAAERYLQGGGVLTFLARLPSGLIFPTWPNGGWSIATELHFYALLPLLLAMTRRHGALPLVVVASALAIRTVYYSMDGEVQSLAYWTIVGRIDQFCAGILAARYRSHLSKVALAFGTGAAFILFFWWFDQAGGFWRLPTYPSSNPIWIAIPSIEAVSYALFIAWFDSRAAQSTSWPSKLFQKLGEYSYSIYLLHFFFVFRAATVVDRHIMSLSNFYVCAAWSFLFCVLMLPIGMVSFRYIESPFLRLRTPYVRSPRP